MRCHACDTRTDGRTVESRAVFCLSRIRNNSTLSLSIELYINWRLGFIFYHISFGEGAILKWHPYVHVMPWWLEYEHQSWQKLLMKYGWRRHFGGLKVSTFSRMSEMNSDGLTPWAKSQFQLSTLLLLPLLLFFITHHLLKLSLSYGLILLFHNSNVFFIFLNCFHSLLHAFSCFKFSPGLNLVKQVSNPSSLQHWADIYFLMCVT